MKVNPAKCSTVRAEDAPVYATERLDYREWFLRTDAQSCTGSPAVSKVPNRYSEGLASSSFLSSALGWDLDTDGDEAVEGGEATSPAPSPDPSRAASALYKR
jgi:hypothetical protein